MNKRPFSCLICNTCNTGRPDRVQRLYYMHGIEAPQAGWTRRLHSGFVPNLKRKGSATSRNPAQKPPRSKLFRNPWPLLQVVTVEPRPPLLGMRLSPAAPSSRTAAFRISAMSLSLLQREPRSPGHAPTAIGPTLCIEPGDSISLVAHSSFARLPCMCSLYTVSESCLQCNE